MIEAILLSIVLSWGWTEFTTEPICQQEVIKDGVKYTMPISCSVLTDQESN